MPRGMRACTQRTPSPPNRRNLKTGRAPASYVLQLISNLTTARVNEIQALANYNIARAQLSLDEGNTLKVNRH